jgi:hypothetical protein
VAGLLLAGLALHQWQIPWLVVAALAALGSVAAATDVLVFERGTWTVFSAYATWGLGFVCLVVIMTGILLVPYGMLAAVSKVFGIWEHWELVGFPWKLLPLIIGGGFGYLLWIILDDY